MKFGVNTFIWTGNFDQPQISGQFKLDGPGSSLGNLNLLARRFNYRFDEISRRDRAVGPDLERELSQDEKGYNYEAGADYEFALVGGRLKLIGLARGEAGDVDGELHELLLEQRHAERLLQRRLEQRV